MIFSIGTHNVVPIFPTIDYVIGRHGKEQVTGRKVIVMVKEGMN